jgi:branched-chain amino acid transport system permease protein
MGTWGGGSLLGVLAAVLLSAAAGAAVALPTLRLRGLYLALATFAFATAMDTVFFNNRLGEGGSLDVQRLDLPGIPTESNTAYFMLSAVAFALCSLGVLAIRRGRYGRQLTALNDSPAACATLGVNTNVTKLVVFAASAGLAGLSGALFGATTVALFPTLQDHVPQVPQLAYLLTGLAAISIGRDPDGVGGQVSRLGERLRARGASRGDAVVPADGLEEALLVHR